MAVEMSQSMVEWLSARKQPVSTRRVKLVSQGLVRQWWVETLPQPRGKQSWGWECAMRLGHPRVLCTGGAVGAGRCRGWHLGLVGCLRTPGQ